MIAPWNLFYQLFITSQSVLLKPSNSMIYYTRKSSKSSNCIDCHILFDTFHCWRPYSFRFYISQPIINDISNWNQCVYLISHNCFSAKQSLETRKMRPNVQHNENVGNQTKQINIYGRLYEQTTKNSPWHFAMNLSINNNTKTFKQEKISDFFN